MNAVISNCGMYRYRLDRMVSDSGPVYAFFGVNPSTADASVDDATVRKWRGFVQRWGGSRFIVGNVFAYRATDVNELATAVDPFGDLIGDHTTEIISEAELASQSRQGGTGASSAGSNTTNTVAPAARSSVPLPPMDPLPATGTGGATVTPVR